MKYFVFSDVHGDFNAMIKALNDAGYEPSNINHQIISCGDNFGRASTGEKSKGVWKYLISDVHYNKPICIKGNHETILLDIFHKNYLSYIDAANGEAKTISSFAHCSKSEAIYNPEMINVAAKTGVEEWLIKLPWFYETKNYIFTHGWLPHPINKYPLADYNNIQWDEASWAHTLNEYAFFKNKYPTGIGKTLVVGHWHTVDFWNLYGKNDIYDIYHDNKCNVYFIDGCTALNHKLNVLVIEDEPIGE